jgi:hypothetical protein
MASTHDFIVVVDALYEVTPDWMAFVGPRQGLDGCCDLADDFWQFSYDRVTNDNLFHQNFGGNRV